MEFKGYKSYLQPAFLICATVLAGAGGIMSIAVKKFGMYLEKEPLPLKKPLNLLDERSLAPYEVVSKQIIENEEVIEALGTNDYLQWLLEDQQAAADSAVRQCSLFITYYDLADKQVPHVPEECYMGAGYQRLGSGEGVTFRINTGGQKRELPGRYVVFSGTASNLWQGDMRFPVLYLFYVNGEYTGSRAQTRFAINKALFSKYSFFSKVELKFLNNKLGQTIYPSEQEAVKAGEKLLAVILPVIEKEHWPDWPVTEDQ